MPAPTSPPCASICWVISAKYRSESVSPSTRLAYRPSRASSRVISPKPPLCAMTRPSMANGCVLRVVRPPTVAQRTCATKVTDWASFASRANSASRNAGSGCLSSTGAPARSKNPMPLPSALRRLCTSSESGASSSQNVALTGSVPAVRPNKRHMLLPPADGRGLRIRRCVVLPCGRRRDRNVGVPPPGRQPAADDQGRDPCGGVESEGDGQAGRQRPAESHGGADRGAAHADPDGTAQDVGEVQRG